MAIFSDVPLCEVRSVKWRFRSAIWSVLDLYTKCAAASWSDNSNHNPAPAPLSFGMSARRQCCSRSLSTKYT
jgi:hypothetical protein